MPTISRPEPRPSSAKALKPALPSPLESLRWLVNLLLAWEERARQRHRLASMDDRMLRDIGLDRTQAEGEYIKPFWRL